MLLQTTPKARFELCAGVQRLAMRERSVLLLADANRPISELRRMFHGMGEQILSDLVGQGYLSAVAPAEAATSSRRAGRDGPGDDFGPSLDHPC